MNMRFQNIYIVKKRGYQFFLEIHLITLHLIQMLPLFITNHLLKNPYLLKIEMYC